MAYDERLAARVRRCLEGAADVSEQPMFGGLAFLVGGHLAVSVSGRGGLMVRVGDEGNNAAIALPHTESFVMRGRPISGWIRVAPTGVEREEELDLWVDRGLAFARGLPSKT
jgi:hypothetical protein